VNVREFRPSDEATLRALYAATDFHQRPFPDLRSQLVSGVLADADDAPLMAGYVRLIPEATLICAPGGSMHPLVKLQGIKLLHEKLGAVLTSMGYSEAIASVPPQLERNYGRHLQRHLNWQESWPTYRILDWRRA
jgi:hypothetical protein